MRRFFILGLLLLFLSACAAPEPSFSFAPAEEDRLVIYTSHREAVYEPIIKEFEERTGVWVQVETGGSGDLLARVEAEAEAPVCDLFFGGGVDSLQSRAALFEPYVSPLQNQLQPAFRCDSGTWTAFSSLPVVLIYNPRLVSPGEVQGWADLLDTRWRGRIAFADPAVSGSSYTAAVTMLTCLPGDDWEELAQLVENLDGGVLADSGDVVEAVSVGSCALGVTLEETALKRQAAGAHIAIVYPAEGTSNLPDAAALVSGAPHRENALAFLEFTQSADVQSLVASDFARRSVRSDIPDDLPPEDSLRLIDYDIAAAAALKEELLERWAALEEGGL